MARAPVFLFGSKERLFCVPSDGPLAAMCDHFYKRNINLTETGIDVVFRLAFMEAFCRAYL